MDRDDVPPKPVAKLLEQHQQLIHSQHKRVLSHTQRQEGEWLINTLMIEDCDTPFRYKRKKRYRDLKGARVDLTYYASTHEVAGISMDVMNVVRIRRS
ncbi:MAG: hypothetical protein AAF184_24820 [Pseudomonadota bacterium]